MVNYYKYAKNLWFIYCPTFNKKLFKNMAAFYTCIFNMNFMTKHLDFFHKENIFGNVTFFCLFCISITFMCEHLY